MKIEIQRFGRLNLTESVNLLKLSSGKYQIKVHLTLHHPASTTFEPLMICYQVRKDEILSVELSDIFLKYLSENLMKGTSGNSSGDCWDVRLELFQQFKSDYFRRLEGVVFEKKICFYST